MKYKTKEIQDVQYTSKAFQLYFKDMRLGVLDIETTGLSPQRNRFVLGGLLTVKQDSLQVEQFFAENLEQEQEALKAYLDAISQTDLLLTYNGQQFDLPFIRGRAGSAADHLPFNLDLYLLVKGYSPIKKFLPNLKQKTVENFMGLWEHRKDEISGKESVDLYFQYISGKDPKIEDKILLHNFDDVVQLYRLLPVLEKADLHKAMYCMGFPIRSHAAETPDLIVEKISFSGSQLHVAGKQRASAVSYQCFQWEDVPCQAHFNSHNSQFAVSVPLIKHSGLTLVDLKAMKLDVSAFEKYPGCQEGFLILADQEGTHYLETNHFIKVFLERMLHQWIIQK